MQYRFSVKLRFPMQFSTWKAISLFVESVLHVIGLRAQEQVVRITATRVVAFVKNVKSFINCAVDYKPCNPVCSPSVCFVRRSQGTISKTVFTTCPFPAIPEIGNMLWALTRFIYFAPKSVCPFSCEFGRWSAHRMPFYYPVLLFVVMVKCNGAESVIFNPSTSIGVTNYSIYYGPFPSRLATNRVSIGLSTNWVVTNIVAGSSAFIYATAWANGVESDASHEILYTNASTVRLNMVLEKAASPSGPFVSATNVLTYTATVEPHQFYRVRMEASTLP